MSTTSAAALALAATPGVRSALSALGALLELEPETDFEGHGRADVTAVLLELQERLKRPVGGGHGVPTAAKPVG